MADETIPPTEEERKAAKRAAGAERIRRWRAKPANAARERVRRLAQYDPQKSAERNRRWKEKDPERARQVARNCDASRNPEKRRAQRRARAARNRDKMNAYAREWRTKNRARHQATVAAYRATHMEEIAAKARRKRASDIQHRLAANLRDRIRKLMNRDVRPGSPVRRLGCSLADFKRHLERQFCAGMTWKNYGNGEGEWNLDHIRPLASFDLTEPDQFLAAVHFTNYQPLWAVENARKGAKRSVLL